MSWLVSALENWAELGKIEEGLASGSASRVRVDGATDPAKALVAAAVARGLRAPLLLVCATTESAERMYEHVLALASQAPAASGQDAVALLPSLEALLYEDVSPDPRLVGDRLGGLARLHRAERAIFVGSAPAVFQR